MKTDESGAVEQAYRSYGEYGTAGSAPLSLSGEHEGVVVRRQFDLPLKRELRRESTASSVAAEASEAPSAALAVRPQRSWFRADVVPVHDE